MPHCFSFRNRQTQGRLMKIPQFQERERSRSVGPAMSSITGFSKTKFA